MAKKQHRFKQASKTKKAKKEAKASPPSKSSKISALIKDFFSSDSIKKIEIQKWEKLAIFAIAFLVAVWLISNRIDTFNNYLHVSDEVDNIRAVECLANTGKITAGMPSTYASVPDFEISGKRFEYWLETILRVPGYLLWKDSKLDWGAYSGFLYFFLLGIVLLGLLFFDKQNKIPVFSIAIFSLLIAYSSWSSASFYFVRYYVFLMYAFIISQFIGTSLLLKSFRIPYLNYVGIIMISFLPSLFHKVGYLTMPVWILIIGIDYFNKRSFNDVFTKKNLKWILIIAGILILGSWYAWTRLKVFFKNFIEITWNIGPGIEKFFRLSMDTSTLGIVLVLGIFVLGIICSKYLSKYERILLATNSLFGATSFIVLMFFMSGQPYTELHGYNRYPFIVHISFLLELGILVTAIIKYILAKIPKLPAKPIIITGILASIFAFGLIPRSQVEDLWMNFSMMPRIQKTEIEKIKKQINVNVNQKPIILTNYGFTFTAFKDYQVFYLTQHPRKNVNIPVNGLNKNGEEGGIYRRNGFGYVGGKKTFCEMLEQFPNRRLFYFYINPSKVGKGLLQSLKKEDAFKDFRYISGKVIGEKICN